MYKIKLFEIKRGKYILFSKRWGQFAQGLFTHMDTRKKVLAF